MSASDSGSQKDGEPISARNVSAVVIETARSSRFTPGESPPRVEGNTYKNVLQNKDGVLDIELGEQSPLSGHALDQAVVVEELGGRHDNGRYTRQESRAELSLPPRLLMLSSKIKNSIAIQGALLPGVTLVQYKFESATLDSLMTAISQSLNNKKVESIAFIVHGSSGVIHLSGKDERNISKENFSEQEALHDFFKTLLSSHIDSGRLNCRMDFLACNAATSPDAQAVVRDIETLLEIPVGISKDITGSDVTVERISEENRTVGELYFRVERLRNWNGNNQQTLAGFEKIRTVGKGAYGTAVLYRKKDDDSLVILKEINLHDLNAAERQMALNEVKVLAMLDHPNIISYYDSFEEDGIVMIEMEYADGGTLAQFLGQQDKPLEEKEILSMFSQMVAAIRHIHEHNILHRDLKTANIFLTREGAIKLGDFGISKLMSTANQAANTVLGTPYYISPEMCEGKAYNDKSDIWALGCILYEMACRQRTFEGSNLPALVNKIMKGQFAPVKGLYTQEFKNLIRDMLNRKPEERPSAKEVWCDRLPELMTRYEDPVTDYEDDLVSSTDNSVRKRKTSQNSLEKRSVLYYLEMSSMALNAIELPSKVKIREVAVSGDHVIVVTMERMVFTWGDGSKGQLGHGTLDSKVKPELVEALKGKSITKACCGEGFSVFASDNGIVMTCGDGSRGCLGHGDWCSTTRPRLIEPLLSVDVVAIACGPAHVVIVGSDGEVFSWGCGADGRLGLGSEEDQCQPEEVSFSEPVMIRDVRCGVDGTMLMTDIGSVLACGNNEHNKLGLNQRQGFLMAMKNIFTKTEVEGKKSFTVVKALARHRVIDISVGRHHSAVLVEPGFVYTFGKNSEGQLGTGNTKPQGAPIEVKLDEEKMATRVQCGDLYTLASRTDNALIFWGTRYKHPVDYRDEQLPESRQHSRQHSTTSIESLPCPKDDTAEKICDSRVGSAGKSSKPERSHSAPERQQSSDSVHSGGAAVADKTTSSFNSTGSSGFRPLSSTPRRRTASASSSKDKDKESSVRDDSEVIFQPTPLLKMDSAGGHSNSGDTVTLGNFFCHGENLFLQVETTAPPPKRRSRKRKSIRKRFSGSTLAVPGGKVRNSASSREGGDEYSSEASELDTHGSKRRQEVASGLNKVDEIPAWIKKELANSEVEMNDGNEPDDTSDLDEEDSARTTSHMLDSSMSSIQINKELKLDKKEKTKKSSDLLMEKKDKDKMCTSLEGNITPKVLTPRKDSGKKPSQTSIESGVEFTPVDMLSSSSSSDTIGAPITSESIEEVKKRDHSPLPPKKINVASSRKVAAPVPFKSKATPVQSQKPLTRIRAQGKVRSRGAETKELSANKPTAADMVLKKEEEVNILNELEKLKAEKLRTEEKLKKMEDEHRRQHQDLARRAELEREEREKEMRLEISNLRSELLEQGNKLQDNYKQVIQLQQQLMKVQSEQMRASVKDSDSERYSVTASQSSSRQSQRESKICLLQ